MTQEEQEEKELLSQELCARLPYGTICEDIYGNSGLLLNLVPELNSVTLKISELGSTWTTDIDNIKPYLRPMSSMTEEEKKEIQLLKLDLEASSTNVVPKLSRNMFWYYEHHFDVNGLIPIGLVIPAIEGMYNT